MSGLGLTFLRRGNLAHPTAGSDYILSADRGDPEVFRILMSKGVSSDGVGISKDDAAKVTTIHNWFYGNTKIKEFSEFQYFTGVTSLGVSNNSAYGAFRNCSNLETLNIPPSVRKIYRDSLSGCSSLDNLSIMWEYIETLEQQALYNCTSLVYDEVKLTNLTDLGALALYGVKVKKLIISALAQLPSASNTSIANYGDRATLEEVVLSNDVTVIPANSFYGYVNLSKLTINAEAITSIGALAFNNTNLGSTYIVNYPNLADETLADRVWLNSKIERFENLGKIQKLNKTAAGSSFGKDAKFVRLPSTFTTFQGYGFYQCSKLETLIIEATNPPVLTTTDFSQTNSTFTIYVPDVSVDSYKSAAVWSNYASRIKPLSEYNG